MTKQELIILLLKQCQECFEKGESEKQQEKTVQIFNLLRLKKEEKDQLLNLYYFATFENWKNAVLSYAEKLTNNISFWDVELNEEEIKYHRLSYGTVARQFDCVLCNNIVEIDPDIFCNLESDSFMKFFDGDEEITEEEYEERKQQIEDEIWDTEHEETETEAQEEEKEKRIEELERKQEELYQEEDEIYQYFIVSDSALWYLKKMNEIVFYSDKLECYIWGVTHWGTSWDYVLTNFKLSNDFLSLEEAEQ